MDQLRQILSTADVAAAKRIDDEEGIEDPSYDIEDNKTLSPTTTTTTPTPTIPPKTRKSDVLLHAHSYVQRSEQEKKNMLDENAWLKRRLVALEKLVRCEDCSLLKQMNMLRMGAGAGVMSTCT